jgi:phosphate transport system substrate-binding protein
VTRALSHNCHTTVTGVPPPNPRLGAVKEPFMPSKLLVRAAALLFLLAGSVLVIGCGKKSNSKEGSAHAGDAESKDVSLSGAGATFPFPLYSKWMSEYNKLHPEVKINYQSIGSGGGIRQITSGTVDFGASDAPMSADDQKKAPRTILHIPTTIGAVVVTYNVAGVGTGLKLDATVVADIFLGTIGKWNDPRIAETNPGVKLPNEAIRVVTRSDGSGTTAVFTGFLAAVSPEFRAKVSEGKSVKWPTGLGAKGNEGVTGQLKTTPFTIGYVELAYAEQNKLTHAAIKNQAGQYVVGKVEAVTEAARATEMPDTMTVSLANAAGAGSYPISSYTYMLVYQDSEDPRKGKALAQFLDWAIHDGQALAHALDYAPLPEKVVEKVAQRLATLKAQGAPLLSQK